MSASIQAKHHVFTLDCPDALALAQFYADLLGWQVRADSDSEDWVDLLPPEGDQRGFNLAFQQIENYRLPDWPEGPVPQQAHLDFYVDSLDEAGSIAEAAGATRHPHQPAKEGSFVVYLDPAGHLFCLCRA